MLKKAIKKTRLTLLKPKPIYMTKYLTIIALPILLWTCSKNEPIESPGFAPDQKPDLEFSESDSLSFIYKETGNIRVTCLPGFPKKSELKFATGSHWSLSHTDDLDSLNLDLNDDKVVDLILWQEYKYHNAGESPSKHAESRKAKVRSTNTFRLSASSFQDIDKNNHFWLNAVFQGDTIGIDPNRSNDLVEIFYCGGDVLYSLNPPTCQGTRYFDSPWANGVVTTFLCWSTSDNGKIVYAITLQFPTREEMIIHAVKKIELNSPFPSPCPEMHGSGQNSPRH